MNNGPTFPPKVEAVLLQALAKKPADRFPTVRAFADALAAASSKPPIGTCLLTYRGHGDAKTAFAWSPDGKLFATGSVSGLIELWDAATWTHIRTCEDHSVASVTSISWSPDGKRLASNSGETVLIWEASSGRLLHCYTGHAETVQAVAWSPDGRYIASGSGSLFEKDDTAQVWEANSGRLLHRYTGHIVEVNAVAWSSDGMRLASGSSDHTVQIWQAL